MLLFISLSVDHVAAEKEYHAFRTCCFNPCWRAFHDWSNTTGIAVCDYHTHTHTPGLRKPIGSIWNALLVFRQNKFHYLQIPWNGSPMGTKGQWYILSLLIVLKQVLQGKKFWANLMKLHSFIWPHVNRVCMGNSLSCNETDMS